MLYSRFVSKFYTEPLFEMLVRDPLSENCQVCLDFGIELVQSTLPTKNETLPDLGTLSFSTLEYPTPNSPPIDGEICMWRLNPVSPSRYNLVLKCFVSGCGPTSLTNWLTNWSF